MAIKLPYKFNENPSLVINLLLLYHNCNKKAPLDYILLLLGSNPLLIFREKWRR